MVYDRTATHSEATCERAESDRTETKSAHDDDPGRETRRDLGIAFGFQPCPIVGASGYCAGIQEGRFRYEVVTAFRVLRILGRGSGVSLTSGAFDDYLGSMWAWRDGEEVSATVKGSACSFVHCIPSEYYSYRLIGWPESTSVYRRNSGKTE